MSDHITLKSGEKKLVVKLSEFDGFAAFEEHVRKEFDREPGVRADVKTREVAMEAHSVHGSQRSVQK